MSLPIIYGSTPFGGQSESVLPEQLVTITPALATGLVPAQSAIPEGDIIVTMSPSIAEASVPAQVMDAEGEAIPTLTPSQATGLVPTQSAIPEGAVEPTLTASLATGLVPTQSATAEGEATPVLTPAEATGLVPTQSAVGEGEVDITFSAPQATASATQIIANYIINASMSPSLATAKATDVDIDFIITVNTLNINFALGTTTSAYRISDTPIINAKYVSNTNNVTVSVLNRKSAYGMRFYGANGVANNFNVLSNINVSDSNTNITFDNSATNASAYKYKVSYFVSGNINSTLVEFEGTRCQPSYLLGD